MLLDTIATIILIGMMLVPVVNIIVGLVVGAGLGGVPGALLGFAAAIAITGAEKLFADLRQWESAAADTGAAASEAPGQEIRIPLRARLRFRALVPRRPLSVPGAHAAPSIAQTLH